MIAELFIWAIASFWVAWLLYVGVCWIWSITAIDDRSAK